jgi:hypothetical protein
MAVLQLRLFERPGKSGVLVGFVTQLFDMCSSSRSSIVWPAEAGPIVMDWCLQQDSAADACLLTIPPFWGQHIVRRHAS